MWSSRIWQKLEKPLDFKLCIESDLSACPAWGLNLIQRWEDLHVFEGLGISIPRFPMHGGIPSHHPISLGFSIRRKPSIGVATWLWKPPYGIITNLHKPWLILMVFVHFLLKQRHSRTTSYWLKDSRNCVHLALVTLPRFFEVISKFLGPSRFSMLAYVLTFSLSLTSYFLILSGILSDSICKAQRAGDTHLRVRNKKQRHDNMWSRTRTSNLGFSIVMGVPPIGWFGRERILLTWMMTGGSPMTLETTICSKHHTPLTVFPHSPCPGLGNQQRQCWNLGLVIP